MGKPSTPHQHPFPLRPTHITGKCFDRLVVAGIGTWTAIEILKPPYGKRPNEANKRVWTDHFFVGATLREQ